MNPGERVLRKTTTFEIIESSGVRRPRIRRDGRGGLNKLPDMIYFLRYQCGHRDEDKIPYDDVEHAIIEISQGLDPRTIKKYLKQLLRFGYLKPVGPPLQKISRVTVTTYSQVDSSPKHNPKEYRSEKGHRSYIFGDMAPKRYVETTLNQPAEGSFPPYNPPSEPNEGVALLERAGVTSEKCVCGSRGEPIGSREVGEEREEGRDTVTHTNRLSESIPEPKKLQPELTAEELRILNSAKKGDPG